MMRDIVVIDESKCDGCGECVPACHEGAIRIVGGKARLVADVLCDGLGACLGHCPRGAITATRQDVRPFDEAAVEAHLAEQRRGEAKRAPSAIAVLGGPGFDVPQLGASCPSARLTSFGSRAVAAPRAGEEPGPRSQLTHWPVQLALLPPGAPVLRGAKLLLAADCVPVAYAGFHEKLLRGRVVVIACPKFDDVEGWVERLASMIGGSGLEDVTVARMEVPCCGGLVRALIEARRQSGRDVPVREVVVGVRGDVLAECLLPAGAI